jgi:nitroreductase
MEFNSVIKKRRSIRDFKSKKVSWKLALEAIDSTLNCPFAGNHNNFKFLILENKDKIEKISKFSNQSWIKKSPLLIIICSDDSHLENLYGERGRVYSRQQAGSVLTKMI